MFLSIEDAVFCSRFLILLAELKFERVSLIQITDKVIQKVGTVAMSCTPIERICLARFISDMLQYFKSVTSVKDFASVADTPAFERIVRDKEGNIVPQAITQTKFVAFLYALHKSLLSEIKECLGADEAYHTQSGLMLLSHLIKMEAFPAYRQHASDLSAAIERRIANLDESHDGVRLVARSLLSPLSLLGSLPDASVHDPSFASVPPSAPAPAVAEAKRKNVPIASIVSDVKVQPASKPPPPSTPHPSDIKKETSSKAPAEKAAGAVEETKSVLSLSSAAPASKEKSPPRPDVKSDRASSRPSDANAGSTSNIKSEDERALKEQKDQVMRSKQANSKPQSSAAEIGSKRALDEPAKSAQQPSSQRSDSAAKSTAAPPASTSTTSKPASRDEPRRDSARDAGPRGGGDLGTRDGSGRDAGVISRDSGGRDARSASGAGNTVDNRERTVVADRYMFGLDDHVGRIAVLLSLLFADLTCCQPPPVQCATVQYEHAPRCRGVS
jgi:hypothetical protein